MKIIVSGADGALGSAVVAHLLRNGHRVASLLGAPDAKIDTEDRFAAGDLADEANASAVMAKAADWLGGVDALVHLVGAFTWAETAGTAVAEWRRMFELNLVTAVASVNAVLPRLADGSSILLVGANSAQPAGQGFGPYGAAKSGVARLTEALAAELRPRRIRANAILPAIIDTPTNRRDMPDADPAEWTAPAAIAEVVDFLVSDRSRAVNGALLPVTNAAS